MTITEVLNQMSDEQRRQALIELTGMAASWIGPNHLDTVIANWTRDPNVAALLRCAKEMAA